MCPSSPVHLTPQPPRGPPVAGGVDGSPGQQLVRREEPKPRVDLCPVRKGPVGALPAHLPTAGEPAQALSHRPELRLALRLHTAAAAAATGRPKVHQLTLLTFFFTFLYHHHHHHQSPVLILSLVFLQQSGERKEDQHGGLKRQLHLSVAQLPDPLPRRSKAQHHVTWSSQSFHARDNSNHARWECHLRQQGKHQRDLHFLAAASFSFQVWLFW